MEQPLLASAASEVGFTASMPSAANTTSNEPVYFASRSRIRNRNASVRSPEVDDKVAGLLGGPGRGRMGGHAEDVHPAGGDVHDEQTYSRCSVTVST